MGKRSSKERFQNFIPFILKAETVFAKGQYGDYKFALTERDPDDPGGTTKFGIDQRSHPKVDIPSLTVDEATDIYLFDYWEKYQCSKWEYPLGEIVMDTCVNCGWGRAQKILKVTTDPKKFLDERAAFYRRLVATNPKMKKYLKGWNSRIRNLGAHLGI